MSRNTSKNNEKANWGVLDLCCGMGGLTLAAKNLGLRPLAGIDTNHEYLESFKANFPDAAICQGDIGSEEIIAKCNKIIKKERDRLKGIVVVSGPPCQGFSVAGKRLNNDPRNLVMVSVAKAIGKLRPDVAIVENVPAINSILHNQVIRKFRRSLNYYGYSVRTFELDALVFGAPQRRRRIVFFINRSKIARQRINNALLSLHSSSKTISQVFDGLPTPKVRPEFYNPATDNGPFANHYAMKHSKKVREKIAKIDPGKGPLSYRKLKPNGFASTLISGHRAPPAHYNEARSITVREAARLQGFPDSFLVRGKFGKQMEQVSNAVPLQLGEAVLNVILDIIEESK